MKSNASFLLTTVQLMESEIDFFGQPWICTGSTGRLICMGVLFVMRGPTFTGLQVVDRGVIQMFDEKIGWRIEATAIKYLGSAVLPNFSASSTLEPVSLLLHFRTCGGSEGACHADQRFSANETCFVNGSLSEERTERSEK